VIYGKGPGRSLLFPGCRLCQGTLTLTRFALLFLRTSGLLRSPLLGSPGRFPLPVRTVRPWAPSHHTPLTIRFSVFDANVTRNAWNDKAVFGADVAPDYFRPAARQPGDPLCELAHGLSFEVDVPYATCASY